MGQTLTDLDVNVDLDAIKTQLAGWYDDNAVVFIN
jgi:hypothetical protein